MSNIKYQISNIIIVLLCTIILSGCQQEPPRKPSQMVLEAWIDADRYPIVLIHKSYILANAPDSVKQLEQIVEEQLIPFGKVTVSDGENEVVLTGRLDTLYLPPYTYTTVDMDGVVGKTYTVTATYEDMTATATTTIPPIAYIDSISITANDINTTDLIAYMSVDTLEEAYYLLYLREFGTKQYQLCPYGVFSNDDATNGIISMRVYNPLAQSEDFASLNYYFSQTDSATYQLKVARVGYKEYQYWKAYNEQIISRGVLFVPVYSNIPGNVEGGIGIFTGMGSSTYRFNLLNDTILRY